MLFLEALPSIYQEYSIAIKPEPPLFKGFFPRFVALVDSSWEHLIRICGRKAERFSIIQDSATSTREFLVDFSDTAPPSLILSHSVCILYDQPFVYRN